MATFAPDIPEQQSPEFLRYSRINEQQPGKHNILLKGVGQAIEEGVKSADTLAGQYFEHKAMDAGDRIMDEEMQKYEPIWRKLQGIPEDQATDKTALKASLIDTVNGKTMPTDVSNGLKTAQNLQDVSNKANNTFSATYAKLRVRDQLKKLREMAPGYRKEIDAGMEKSTGMAGANEAYNGILSDINSFISKADAEKNKESTQVHQAAAAGMIDPETYMGYLKGKVQFNDVMDEMSRNASTKFKTEQSNRLMENTKMSDEAKKRVIGDRVSEITQSVLDDAYNKIGMRGDTRGLQGLIDYMGDLVSGKKKPEDQGTLTKTEYLFDQAVQDTRQRMYAQIKKINGSDSIDPKIISERVDERMKELTTLQKAIKDKNYPLAQIISQQIKDKQQDADFYLHQTDAGKLAMLTKAAHDIDPQFGTQVFSRTFPDGDSKYKPAIDGYIAKFINPPAGKPAPVFMDAIKELRDKGADPSVIHEHLLRTLESIPEATNPTAIRSLAKSAFSPENLSYITKASKDAMEIGPDGSYRLKPNFVDVYRRMLAPDILSKIDSIKDPEVSSMVQTFAENSFSFGIAREALKDFKNIQIEHGSRITWNDTTKEFGLDTSTDKNVPLLPSKPTPEEIRRMGHNPTKWIAEHINANTTENPRIRVTLGNLNRAIGSLKDMGKFSEKYKGDPDAVTRYIFDTLKSNGIDFTDSTPNGLPEAMAKAIGMVRAHKEADRLEQERRRLKSNTLSK